MERPIAGPGQYRYGSPHYSLEPHTQKQTTQSTYINQLDANDHELVIKTYSYMPNQQLGNGRSLPQNIYQHQPSYMTGPFNVPITPSFPVEQSFYNGFINEPPAPQATQYCFVPLAPNANLGPPSAPLQSAQNPDLNLDPALQHPSYEYAPAIPPPTSNAGYLSLGDQASPSDFYHDVTQPNPLQAQSGFYHGIPQPGPLPAQSDFCHGVVQPSALQAQNNAYDSADQPSPRRARKRCRTGLPEHDTAPSGNSSLQPNAAQVGGGGLYYEHARADESGRDPTTAGVPARWQKFDSKIKETLSNPNKPPTSRDNKPPINAPEDFDDPQLVDDCKSQKLAVPGGLKYSGPGEARFMAGESKRLFHKKPERCTYPNNDETFPRTDAEWWFCALLIYNAMVNWESYQEWMKCLPEKLRNKKQQLLIEEYRRRRERRVEILQARQSNNASSSDGGSIRADEADHEEVNRPIPELADLLPTPEEVEDMPSLADQQKKVLGRTLNTETASEESWRLLKCAFEAQQGRSGARPGTGKDGSWESYPSFLDRILAIVNVLRTTKQVVKDLLTLGDGGSQRLANSPYAAQASKGENLKNNVGKKFPKSKLKAEATEKAEGPGKKANTPEPKGSTSNFQHLGEAGESGLSFVDADDSRADPSLENEGEPSRDLLTAGDHTQLEGHSKDNAEAAVLEYLRQP
ncbi:unnamed protein product [Clonostachys rhizophaga]|uniref:Uncharacterized protein n=1 Tax=Clonostachys rhizophaga TaxID=160324 RepID=A0A9N9VLS1_9HYPO|nr:unnamed protein product [Clonostachys rhizophaga]